MTTGNQGSPGANQSGHPRYIIRRIVIVAVILVLGIVAARYLIKSKPKVSRKPPEKIAPLVSVSPLEAQTKTITVTAMGTIVPAKEIMLKTSVGGEIISVNDRFSPGGVLDKGEIILQIDPRDYELALQQKEKALSDALYAFKLEQGRQDVAKREWDLLYGDGSEIELESDLALRKPHLEKVQADTKSAEAEKELAEINLQRTTVTAPFNALVLNKYVDIGAFVAPQEKLADLVGTDEYWAQVSVPLNRLRWLKIPQSGPGSGSRARIYYREKYVRDGKVARLQGDLTREGRMARLLVTIPDPLGLSAEGKEVQPLIIGEYVRVEIQGEELQDVFTIPRTALHNDNEIWIAAGDGILDIRRIETIWRDEESVLVRDGLQQGELLIVSNLPVPVQGMPVRIESGNAQ